MNTREVLRRRNSVIVALLGYLAPGLRQLEGRARTEAIYREIARATLPGLLAAREALKVLADDQYRDLVSDPIDRPPLRDFTAESWFEALRSAAPLPDDDRFVGDPDTPIEREDVEKMIVSADFQAREAERNALVAYSLHDDNIAGWARVDFQPPTCPFCTLLISRGPVYTSAKSAGKRNRYHKGCTCEVILVTDSTKDSYRGRDITVAANQLYKDATKKGGLKEFRAQVTAQNEASHLAETGRTQRAAEKVSSTNRPNTGG